MTTDHRIDCADWHGHVIVCGLHNVGLRVIEQLHAAGEEVVVIEDGDDTQLGRVVDSLDVPRIQGDPTRLGTLHDAGIDGAAALICTDSNDLRNLGVALLARETRPEVRLVVALRNAPVGRALERITGHGTVLDVAKLAAPSFVESCLRRDHHVVNLGGTDFAVATRTVKTSGTLRKVFGDLAPIAVIRRTPQLDSTSAEPSVSGEPQEMLICPGRDRRVTAGDQITLFGPISEFADLNPSTSTQPASARAHRVADTTNRIRSTVAGFVTASERSLWVALLCLLSVGLVSMALLMSFYRGTGGHKMGVIDSAYFTSETLTTVGFGDFSFSHQHPWLRVWAIVLMILGATLVTVVYAMLTNVLISRRLDASAGRRAANRISGHVILIGLGAVGLRVLEGLLAERRQVVVVERDEDNRFIGAARAHNVPIIIADSTIGQNLAAANLHSASAIAVLTSNDLANIETALAADDLLGERNVEVPVVLRVFDRQLAHTVEHSFGFKHVRSTSELAAPWFVGAALGLDVLNTFYVERQAFLVGRFTVADAGGLAGTAMRELATRTRVVAISRRGGAEMEYPPRRDTRFEPGDEAYLVGPYEELIDVLRRDQRS